MSTTMGFQRRLARKETTATAADNSPPGYVALLEDATRTIGVKRSMSFEYVTEDDNTPTRDHRRIEEVGRAEVREQQVATWQRNSDQSYSSLSPQMKSCIESGTDKVLTFLQSARENNIPVRSGKWSCEEDQYLRVLVMLFCDGVLEDVEQKTSMRAWLSKMLNCCPMRISKKQMHGEKFTGKAKFQRSSERIKYMTQAEYDQACIDVIRLRTNFINYWAKEEFNRSPSRRCILSFEDWQKKISAIVPEAKVAKNPRLAEFNRNNLQKSVVTLSDRNDSRRKRHRTTSKPNVTVELRSSTRTRHQSRKFCSYESQTCEIVQEANCSPMTTQELPLSQPSQHFEASTQESTSTIEQRIIVNMKTESEMCATQMMQSSIVPNTPHLHHVSMDMDFMNAMDHYQIEDLLIPRKLEDIFLDFGTPSLWSLDDAKNAYPGHCEWNDDDLFDDLAMLYEPEILAMSTFAQDAQTIRHQGCANPEILDATTMFCGYAPMI